MFPAEASANGAVGTGPGPALWEWAAGEQGGCEGDRVLRIRVGKGHGLVSQGLAALPSTCTCPEGSVGPMCPGPCCWPQGTGQSPTPPLAGTLGASGQSLGQMAHSCHSLQACTRAVGSWGHMVRGPCAVPPGSLQCGLLLSTGGGRRWVHPLSSVEGIARPSREWL